MNDLTDRRREVLERGLAEFDAATRRRRTRAWAGRSLAAIAVVAACTAVVLRTVAPAVPAETGESCQAPPRACSWRNTTTRTPSERSCRPRM